MRVEGVPVTTFGEDGAAVSNIFDVMSAADVRLVEDAPFDGWRFVALGAGALLVLLLLAFAVYRLRVHRQRADERLLAADRRRIADDLHDNMQQLLAGVGFRLDAALNRAESPAIAYELANAKKALEHSQAGLRSVLWGLQETRKSPDSLVGLLRYAASRMPHWEGIVTIEGEGDEPPKMRRHGGRLLMILQEAVGNALTHGEATRVDVRLKFDGGAFAMSVADNGCGFAAASANANGIGLQSMRRRTREMGGELRIESAPGKGTTVTVEVKHG